MNRQMLRAAKAGMLWSVREPKMLSHNARLVLGGIISRNGNRTKILVGTHHKVLTVYFLNVFKQFALLSNRTMASSHGHDIDYSADILRSTHSRFDFGRLDGPWCGLHVVRDPRDVLVSAMKYHLRSTEPWLHVPRENFGGKTYQQALLEVPTDEERLLFEIDNATGRNISEMMRWNYDRSEMAELRYEQLVREGGTEYFLNGIGRWGLSHSEQEILGRLFEHFSIYGRGSKNLAHIRNPNSGQWSAHFSPRVEARFNERFPDVLSKLGYA